MNGGIISQGGEVEGVFAFASEGEVRANEAIILYHKCRCMG